MSRHPISVLHPNTLTPHEGVNLVLHDSQHNTPQGCQYVPLKQHHGGGRGMATRVITVMTQGGVQLRLVMTRGGVDAKWMMPRGASPCATHVITHRMPLTPVFLIYKLVAVKVEPVSTPCHHWC